MSFGVGLADIFETLHFAKVTYDSWKEAPERYRAIESRLRTLRSTLQRLVAHYQNTQRHRPSLSQRDLKASLESIENTLDELARIIEQRSGLKFWDRLRLNSHQINDLSAALDRHIQDLICLCSALGLENDRHLRRGQEQPQSGQHALKRGQDELLHLVGQFLPSRLLMLSGQTNLKSNNPFWTIPYFAAGHSKQEESFPWRSLGREVIAEGATSSKLPSYQEMLLEPPPTVPMARRGTRAPAPPAKL